MKFIFIFALLFCCFCPSAVAQSQDAKDNTADSIRHHDQITCSHEYFNLGAGESGICFGNSAYHRGIRFNVVDCGVKEVNGINITFWKGADATLDNFRMSGISLGLMPCVGYSEGIAAGIGAVEARHDLTGLNFGGAAVVSGGMMEGINIAGIASVAGSSRSGISISGLATVAGKQNQLYLCPPSFRLDDCSTAKFNPVKSCLASTAPIPAAMPSE